MAPQASAAQRHQQTAATAQLGNSVCCGSSSVATPTSDANAQNIFHSMAHAITDAPALLVAGVGLSFLGLELVTNALQESTSRTVRGLVKRSTRSRLACALVGVAAGGLVQST